jgi:hypothetical protein
MATMIPDSMPRASSAGEKRMFAALQKLPDECFVYYEPVIAHRYPDFVVLMPDVGLLVIEVKGWYPADILEANTHDVRTRSNGQVSTSPHPLRQAREYMFRLMDVARAFATQYEDAARLLHKHGERAGKFIFPFGTLACLSNITRDQLATSHAGEIGSVFGSPRTMTRNELQALEDATSSELLTRLKACFEPWWPFPTLDSRQIDALRAIIHPEIVLGGSREEDKEKEAPGPEHPPPTIDPPLKVLDPIQEANALSIGDGHRVIYGVAGSGKTVLLIARAKRLAENPEKRILVLCFNRALAEHLQTAFSGYENIRAMHFHGWGGQNGATFRPKEDDEAYGVRLLDRLESGHADGRSYDAVLIDEAQDFERSWLQCAKAALKEPDDGDLIIVGDGSQMLYRRGTFTWQDAGIHAVGRTIVSKFGLERNYRNTRQILRVAIPFAAQTDPATGSSTRRTLRISEETARRSGVEPSMLVAASRAAECQTVVALVTNWLAQGAPSPGGKLARISANEIEILYPRLQQANQAVMEKFVADLRRVAPVSWWKHQNGEEDVGSSISVRTMHSAKGLQRRAIVLLWTDLLPMGNDPEQMQQDRGLLYMALTRAEDVLVMTRSGRSAFTDELERLVTNTAAGPET